VRGSQTPSVSRDIHGNTNESGELIRQTHRESETFPTTMVLKDTEDRIATVLSFAKIRQVI
jgi:hypothetical protein